MNHGLYRIVVLVLMLSGIRMLAHGQQSWYDQAKAATDNNRKVAFYTKSLELEGESAFTYYYRGWAYYSLGKYESAVKDFSAAEKAGGIQVHQTAISKGWSLYANGKYDQALKEADRALEAKNNYADAWNLKGWCKYQSNDAAGAVAAFDKLVAAEPNKAESYANRSQALFMQGEYAKVLSDCDKALGMKADLKQVQQTKALALIKLGRNEEGMALVKDKVNYTPDDPASISQVGRIFYDNGDYKSAIEYQGQAIRLYEKKCQLDREYLKKNLESVYNIFLQRGMAYQALDDKQRALADFKHATTLNPEDYRAWIEIGEIQTFQKNYSEGAQAYERAFAINPDLKDGWVNLGFCYDRINQPTKAISAYTRGIRNNPDVGLLYNNRGFGYLEMNRFEEAYADLVKAIEVEPQIMMSHVSLGEYYYARKMYAESIAKLTEALKMEEGTESSFTAAYYTRGLCHFDQGQFEKAKSDFLLAIQSTHDHVMAHEKLGISYYNLGDHCNAYKTLKKTLELESTVSNKEAKEAPKYLGKMTVNPCTK